MAVHFRALIHSGRGTRDMTRGPIIKQVLVFSLPIMIGNLFQMLYNTVDVIVVGNFVGKEALAAVGSTTMIINILVFFFNGFSVGAGVVIGQLFGAGKREPLHDAVETTVAMTLVLCVIFTGIGVAGVKPMLRFMSTPEDVFHDAQVYLTIYFAGISGLLIYNIGGGILRSVGNSTLPLLFLILTSLLNIVLDLLFVIGLHAGIAGVAYATILSQFLSAALTLMLLTRSKEIYALVWRDLRIKRDVLGQIFLIGLPAGIQSVLTSFSNVFVQSYVNAFGSACMAGWSCYNKLDQFILLPVHSMSMAATAFVSQNMGANKLSRVRQGTAAIIALALSVSAAAAGVLFVFAPQTTGWFSRDPAVIEYGTLFLRANVFFLLANCVNHTLAGALRGRGDSTGPMVIMLANFVGVRQLYLFVVTRWIANTPLLVGLGYPVGWTTCMITEVFYYRIRYGREASRL